MAYELHIEKDGSTIRLEDWKSAVAELDGVRLCSSEHSITNPESGDVISVPRHEGDVEVYFLENRTWRTAFYWFNGRISFKAMLLPENTSDPVWQAATVLASRLDAVVRGDEGEVYDLTTGKVVS